MRTKTLNIITRLSAHAIKSKKSGRPCQIDKGQLLNVSENLFAKNGLEGTAVISLMGPVIYSEIGAPILKKVYGFKQIDEVYIQGLCKFLTETFFNGNSVVLSRNAPYKK